MYSISVFIIKKEEKKKRFCRIAECLQTDVSSPFFSLVDVWLVARSTRLGATQRFSFD